MILYNSFKKNKKIIIANLSGLGAFLWYLLNKEGFSWETLSMFLTWLAGCLILLFAMAIMFRMITGVWTIEDWKNK